MMNINKTNRSATLNVFRYDKTFEGLLTAVFEAYSRKVFPDKLLSGDAIEPMFTQTSYTVVSHEDKSARVWAALENKLSKMACRMLWAVWLSEQEGSDHLLFRFICKAIDSKQSIEGNFGDEDVLNVLQLSRKVNHEGHYLRELVRFQKTADNTYFAAVSPQYNALPLVIEHFIDRFADQRWVIYDLQRRYGFYYDLHTAVEITLEGEDSHLITGKLDENLMANDEKMFQQMWKNYFKAMTIKERINPKLQRQNMPKRFWKYLTEKQ